MPRACRYKTQASHSIRNVRSWGALVDGVEQCSSCSTLSLVAVPSRTKGVMTQIELMLGIENALVFLALMFHRG